jgi:hypothetical protein
MSGSGSDRAHCRARAGNLDPARTARRRVGPDVPVIPTNAGKRLQIANICRSRCAGRHRLISRDFGALSPRDAHDSKSWCPRFESGSRHHKARDPAWLLDALVGGALAGRARLLLSGTRGVFGSNFGPESRVATGFLVTRTEDTTPARVLMRVLMAAATCRGAPARQTSVAVKTRMRGRGSRSVVEVRSP